MTRTALRRLGEWQVNSYQHAAQAIVFRDSLAGASCLYLGFLVPTLHVGTPVRDAQRTRSVPVVCSHAERGNK